MKALALLFVTAVATLLVCMPATPAQAQNSVSFVRSDGNDVLGVCTRSSPCLTIGFAISQTAAGGEIKCLDFGPFAPFTAGSKSITVDCNGGSVANVGAGTAVNIAFGSNAVVTLRNLTVLGVAADGKGIDVTGTGTLIVEGSRILGFSTGQGTGIRVVPTGGQTAQLVVTDSLIANNGAGTSGAGIVISPTPTGSATLTLDRVRVEGNITGVFLTGVGSTNIRATIKDSTVAQNAFTGVYAFSSGGGVTVALERMTVSNNGGIGVYAEGGGTFMTVSRSTITGNGIGWTFVSGGHLITYLDNRVSLNVTNGTPSSSLPSD